jgi:hypothetical protein
MWRVLIVAVLAVVLSACAHHRQPKVRCTGPLEGINVSTPANTGASDPAQQGMPSDDPNDEGSAS